MIDYLTELKKRIKDLKIKDNWAVRALDYKEYNKKIDKILALFDFPHPDKLSYLETMLEKQRKIIEQLSMTKEERKAEFEVNEMLVPTKRTKKDD